MAIVSESIEALTNQPAPTKLYVAMHKARTAMSMVAKGGENKFDKYKYATLADYLDAIQQALDDNGLLVVSHINEINWLQDRETKGGGYEKVCRIMLRTTVIHAESGEQISVTVLGEGQDRGDKAFYKADTGARKYALANLFNLATDDDPETDSPQHETQQRQAAARPANGQQTAAKPHPSLPFAPPEQQKPVANFQPPPNWPDSTAAQVCEWLGKGRTVPGLKVAFGLLTGEPKLRTVPADWKAIVEGIGNAYMRLTEQFTKNRDFEFEPQVKQQLEMIEAAEAVDKSLETKQEPAAT